MCRNTRNFSICDCVKSKDRIETNSLFQKRFLPHIKLFQKDLDCDFFFGVFSMLVPIGVRRVRRAEAARLNELKTVQTPLFYTRGRIHLHHLCHTKCFVTFGATCQRHHHCAKFKLHQLLSVAWPRVKIDNQ